jgi:hypothetical protein
MKRWLALALVLLAFSPPAFSDNPVQIDQSRGFRDIATPTFQVASSTATNIGLLIPSGAKGFFLYSFNGKTVVNSAADLQTGSTFTGIEIASGSYMAFSGLNPDGPAALLDISAKANGVNQTDCRLICW